MTLREMVDRSYNSARFAVTDSMRSLRKEAKKVGKSNLTQPLKYGKTFNVNMKKEDKQYKKMSSWRW